MSEWQRVPWWLLSIRVHPHDLAIGIGRWELRFFRSTYHNRLFVHLTHFSDRTLMPKLPAHKRRYWMIRCDRAWRLP